MITRIKKFLASAPYMKIGEHLALSFAGAFALAAIGTTEHAASANGFSLSWSFIAGVAASAATAAYHKVRPQLIKTFLSRFIGDNVSMPAAKK